MHCLRKIPSQPGSFVRLPAAKSVAARGADNVMLAIEMAANWGSNLVTFSSGGRLYTVTFT